MASADPIQLLERIVIKDRRAFGEFYDLFAARVYGLSLKICRSVPDAEEVTQDVFSFVWQKASAFDAHRGKVETWLVTLARSRSIDRLRSRNRRERSTEPLPEDFEAETLMDAGPRPGDSLETHGLLARLSSIQREALELAYFEGLTQSQIAVKLDIPLGTVKTRLRDALQKLREWVRSKENAA